MAKQGCSRKKRDYGVLRVRKRGFTLIELLVVIAIIALLLSVLLPALRKAKETAYSVVCRAHLRGAGMGVTTYTTENDNWLPGPNTSGLRAASGASPSTPTDPVQNVDWISPSMGHEIGLAGEKVPRLKTMFNTDLRCPANKVKYDYAFPGTILGLDPQELYYSSYSAVLYHHYLSNVHYDKGIYHNKRIVHDMIEPNKNYNRIRIAETYRPKQDRVGTPSRKVWAMDGARYYHSVNGTSFNDIPFQDDGGNFMIRGPIYPVQGDPYFFHFADKNNLATWTLQDITLKLAYRHNKRINVVFLDGHCETLDLEKSLTPSYYLPKGTFITPLGASILLAPNVGSGYIR